jgi:serine/threonine protein kinase
MRRERVLCVITSSRRAPSSQAPEMCRTESYTEKVDVWSLGMVLLELVCARVCARVVVTHHVRTQMTLDLPYRLNHFDRFELPKKIAAGVKVCRLCVCETAFVCARVCMT